MSVCPDCEAVINEEIRMEDDGTVIRICPVCGVVHTVYDCNRFYQTIGQAELEEKLIFGADPGRYVCDTGCGVCAIDNTDGEMEYEEFPDMIECLAWLLERSKEE